MNHRTQRRRARPDGRADRTRVLTAEYGRKPAWMTWRTFHYLADTDPDKLRTTLAADARRRHPAGGAR